MVLLLSVWLSVDIGIDTKVRNALIPDLPLESNGQFLAAPPGIMLRPIAKGRMLFCAGGVAEAIPAGDQVCGVEVISPGSTLGLKSALYIVNGSAFPRLTT
jgi:hypothetical protein